MALRSALHSVYAGHMAGGEISPEKKS